MHNKFIRIAIAAVIAVLLATWAGSVREPKVSIGSGELLVPGLADELNSVAALKITGADNLVIATLGNNQSGWGIVEKNGYPADVSKIREYLIKLSEARVLELKTSDPANYATLGVEEISAKEAKGALIEVSGLKEPVRLIVGNANTQVGEGTFVRRADQAQSLLVKGNIAIDKVAANWLLKDIADIPSSRVREVRIVSPGKSLRVFKNDPGEPNFQVGEVPKGRAVASEFVANGFASVLSGLRFDDVLPIQSAEPGAARVWTSTYTMFDGLQVQSLAWNADGKDYARFVASLDEAAAGASIDAQQAAEVAGYAQNKIESEAAAKAALQADPNAQPPAAPAAPLAVSDPGKDREDRLAALREETAALNARLKDWTYVIPAFKFANMNKTLDDMLQPPASK